MNDKLVRWEADDSGELLTGAFYDLSAPRFIPGKAAGKDDRFVGGVHFGYERPEYVKSSFITDVTDDARWVPCPAIGTSPHKRLSQATSFAYVSHSARYSPIVWSTTGLCVRGDVATEMLKEPFKGLTFLQAKCDSSNEMRRRSLFLVERGKEMRVRSRFAPAFDNRCPFCGENVVCTECRRTLHLHCAKAGRRVFLLNDDSLPEDGFAIVCSTWQGPGDVLDASTWDGSDFSPGMHGSVVTPRVIRTLIERDWFPFSYRPLRAYVGSCSKDERSRLERMRSEGP